MLKCLLCGKKYKHLGSHIWHGHKITAREYKEEFGLPYKMALITEEIKEKKREKFYERADEYLENLKKSGNKYQFKKGQTGHRRISEHERKIIIERINSVNKRKKTLQPCPVCKMKFNHIESHLYNAHKLIIAK